MANSRFFDPEEHQASLDRLSSLLELSISISRRPKMRKGMIYHQMSMNLVLECQRIFLATSSREDPLLDSSVMEELERIRGRLSVMSRSMHLLEEGRISWNPRKIIKSYFLRRRHVRNCLVNLKLASGTSNNILRKLLTADLEPGDDHSNDRRNATEQSQAGKTPPQPPPYQSEDPNLEQVETAFEGTRDVPSAPQTLQSRINLNIFYKSVIYMGSGPSHDSLVASRSNRAGGNRQLATPSSPST
ncbi:hypothetical protein SERLA73DRAFT_188632 [Serpula lacrymans var. lacrymans S7.3]|uniref:Uncharacterized protein n=2 Tax=Serpula lacrymans var. lacrymans TaxID=341189 RepID=F8QBU9_SERL3|nr:uncharacterized protein SERLADRAFT_478967 [Serpula lacrymans var. lacrymans S7.9]EGN94068.1 hypothetical protein SERLA73DRAFT_188632 [Serpula lacrymans var. lacrymans S7.3]EGO19485.1 hypothetical protein SERLADRAFT_478967 [Serpula lacrymans var. lacrymans S7.9]